MLADLKAAWHLRGPSIGPRRLAYVAVLILLAGVSDGIGLMLLVPLLSSLGAPMPTLTGVAGWLFALLPGTLAGLLLVFLAVAVLRAVIDRLQSNAVARLRFDYAVDLKTRTYAAIANASWSYLRRKRAADFHALFASEIDRVEHGVQLLLEVPARLVIFLAHIAIGIAIAPAFSALAIALGLCLMWGLRRRLIESRRLGDIVSEASLHVNREITEFLQALKLTKAYGAEAQHVRAFSDAVQQAEGAGLVSRRLLANTELILEIATAVVLATLLWLAAGWLELPLASLLVLILVFQRIMPKFQEIQGSGMNIERNAVAVPEFEVAQRTGRRKRDGSIERRKLQIRRRTLGIADMGIGSCGDVPVELFLHAPSRIDPTTLMYTISCKYIDGEEVTRPDRSGNCGIVIAVP